MKIEKVWKTLLLPFSSLLIASAANAVEQVTFRDYDAVTKTFTNAVRECTLVTAETRTLGSGWYAVQGEVTIPEGVNLTVNGDAHLILCDEATLRIPNPGYYAAAIRVSGTNSLTFYGQTEGSGHLIAYGGNSTACIGGANGDKGGAVTINGGKMTVTGGHHGAGIGGGSSCSDFTVTINGGTVTAYGSKRGAGIGGGDANTGVVVTINGGIVNASGGISAAGIGGGLNGAGGTVTINGGQVTATGDAKGAGIGSGEECNGGTVTINGGQVTATGGGRAAGIGGGQCGTDFMVTISGGVVNAHGGSGAASIGSGYEGAGGTVMISGGQVTATGTVTSADIGSGYDAKTPCTIAISGGIFWKEPENDWLATHCLKVENPDEATKDAYPWKVIPPCVVTVGANLNMGVVWTSGDGTKMNEVRGASFTVPYGTENVKVIFTADDGYEIVGENTVTLGTVTGDIVFGVAGGYMVPEVAITDPCLIAFGRSLGNMSVVWTRGDGSVTNVVAGNIKGTYVPRGSENVRIICAANPGYELVGASVIDLGTVTKDVVFGQGNDYKLPIAYNSVENVIYPDWDEASGQLTDRVARKGDWTAVTEATRVLKGCMVVTNDVTVPYLEVSPYSAVLVLCNDATLNVTGAVDEAGIEVASDRSLTITVRKGSSGRVVAQGGRNCAGIGSRFQQGAGSVLGAVKIVAGTVTATGGSNAAGIGNGFYGKGGSVKIFGGAVTATGGIGGASDIGDGSNPYSPCEVSVSGGVFARSVQDAWCADHFAVFANDDPASRADYPYAVLPSCMVTIGECPIHVTAAWTSGDGSATNAIESGSVVMPDGTPNVRVIFTAESGWELVGESVVNLGTVTGDITFGVGNDYKVPHAVPVGAIDYLDWDAVNETLTNATVAAGGWTLVTDATRTLNDGWYVVASDVAIPVGSNIVVNGSAHLILCDGASLSVTGGYDQAAIEVLSSGSVTNTLTIYGQTECTGRLTVQGGDRAAGIGSGFYGDFGAVTINGGTVTATGGWGCPAIGNGWWGQGGAVTINAGRVVAAGDMRRGNCAVSIRGGVFGMSIPDAWCAEHRGMFPNPDSATSAEYPYAVLPAWKVTIGDRQHMTVEWTSDDGQMTNAVEGTSFKVRLGERNVRVIFTADSDYALAGDAVVRVGTVNSDIVFGVGNDFKAPYAGIPYLDWDETNRVMTNAVSPVACDEYSTSIRDLQDGHWYVVKGEHTIREYSGLRVSGDVHIILCDGSSLSIVLQKDPDGDLVTEPGIEVGEGSSLTVYGQVNGSGRLVAVGGDGGAAGIGGREGGACGAVTINGGEVSSAGGSDYSSGASGIGTGNGGYGGRVTINGGVVTATGNEYGAGIGDDYRGRNMTVIINGGTVTATGGADGASIKGDNVSINDGAIDVGNMGGVIAVFGGVFRTQPQVGWLAAARSVVPNMDLTTADTHPWRVVESATVVSLDAPLGPFATVEEATNAMATAVFAPSEEIVSRILLRGVSPRRYSEKFGFGVTSKGEGAWYVEAALTDAAKAYLAETATKATLQIPVAEIAKYDEETIHGFWVRDCEPGFYYTLYCAAEVCSLPDKGTKCGPAMCFEDGELMFNWVDKPSAATGFFTIGVSATKGE